MPTTTTTTTTKAQPSEWPVPWCEEPLADLAGLETWQLSMAHQDAISDLLAEALDHCKPDGTPDGSSGCYLAEIRLARAATALLRSIRVCGSAGRHA